MSNNNIEKDLYPIFNFIKGIEFDNTQNNDDESYGIFYDYKDIINLIKKTNLTKCIMLIEKFNFEEIEKFDQLYDIINIIIYQGEETNNVFIFPNKETFNKINEKLEQNNKNNNKLKKITILGVLCFNQKLFTTYYLSLGQIANLIFLKIRNYSNNSILDLESIEDFLIKIEELIQKMGSNDEKTKLSNNIQSQYLQTRQKLLEKKKILIQNIDKTPVSTNIATELREELKLMRIKTGYKNNNNNNSNQNQNNNVGPIKQVILLGEKKKSDIQPVKINLRTSSEASKLLKMAKNYINANPSVTNNNNEWK